MSEKYTKGPWGIWTDTNGRLRVGPSSNYSVAEMFQTPLEGQEANANIIAAAPELLWVVRLAISPFYGKPDSECPNWVKPARAAIFKATGEPQ